MLPLSANGRREFICYRPKRWRLLYLAVSVSCPRQINPRQAAPTDQYGYRRLRDTQAVYMSQEERHENGSEKHG